MKIKSIIVEDTFEGMQAIKVLLQEHCPQIEIVGEASNNDEAYRLINEVKPQLAFLDINLNNETSFQLLKRLYDEDKIDFEFIFFTAHGETENLVKALRLSALDFFQKPVDKNELIAAVRRVEGKINKTFADTKSQLEMMFELAVSRKSENDKIAIQLLKGIIERIEIKNILWLETDEVFGKKNSNMTKFVLSDGTFLRANKNIGYYKKMLASDYDFFSISQSVLINRHYLRRYVHSTKTVYMENGKTHIASKRHGQKLKDYLSSNRELSKLLKEDSTFTKWLNKMLHRFDSVS